MLSATRRETFSAGILQALSVATGREAFLLLATRREISSAGGQNVKVGLSRLGRAGKGSVG